MEHRLPAASDVGATGQVRANRQKQSSLPAFFPSGFLLSSFFAFFRAVKPYAPQLVPLIVFIILLPAVILISFFAGFIVWNNVAVAWDVPIYLQYGYGQAPFASASLPKMAPQQLYDISVQLTVPAVESNFALGNFMTTLTLSTSSNRTISSISQPAIAYSPKPSLFLRHPSTITLNVPMLSSFRLGSSSDLVAFVQLGRHDSWRGVGTGVARELSVISSSIRGAVVHRGIRGLVARFPLTSALISTATFLTILLFMLAICTLPAGLRKPVAFDADKMAVQRRPDVSPGPELDDKLILRRRSKARVGTRRAKWKTQSSAVAGQSGESIRRRATRTTDRAADFYS